MLHNIPDSSYDFDEELEAKSHAPQHTFLIKGIL